MRDKLSLKIPVLLIGNISSDLFKLQNHSASSTEHPATILKKYNKKLLFLCTLSH